MSNDREAAERMLHELADVMRGFDENLEAVREGYRLEAANGSQVARELAEEAEVSTEELRRPILDTYGVATAMMLAATDHLVMLGEAIRPPPRPFAPQTLARQGVELLARAFHLMEPDMALRERAARFATEMLYSLWETKRSAGGHGRWISARDKRAATVDVGRKSGCSH